MQTGFSQIEGSVSDKNKTAIKDVVIFVTDSSGKIIDSVGSDDRGGYFFTGLNPGLYNLNTKSKDFDPASYKNIRVTVAPEGTNEDDDTYYAIRVDIILTRSKTLK